MTARGIAALYEPVKAPEPGYFDALGRFVDLFALAETAVQLAFWHHAKLDHDVARALLGGTRSEEVLNRLSRLTEVGKLDAAIFVNLKPILDQYNSINKIRNNILHYGSQTKVDGRRIISDWMRALTHERTVSFQITNALLEDMSADLKKIIALLHTQHMGRPPLRGNHPELDALLRGPWQHKSPLASRPKERADTARVTRNTKRKRVSRP